MSIDKFEQQFLNKNNSNIDGIDITSSYLSFFIKTNLIPIGKVIEIRSKDLSGMFISLDLINSNKDISLLIDLDKTYDYNWNSNNRLGICTNIGFEKIKELTDVRLVIINSILGLIPEDKDYEKLENELKEVIDDNKNKIFIFINPYLDNKYDIISKYTDLILVNHKRTSITKNEEKLGYNFDCEIIRNTINYNLGKTQFKLFYKEGIKNG